MGNICRSPAAENVMQYLINKSGFQERYDCDSAGTIGYHQGEAPDNRMQSAAKARGIILQGKSRKFLVEDFSKFDHIFTMDQQNYEDVLGLATTEQESLKVKAFCNYLKQYQDKEIPDPYYGGPQGFSYVMDLLEDGCQNILNELESKKL